MRPLFSEQFFCLTSSAYKTLHFAQITAYFTVLMTAIGLSLLPKTNLLIGVLGFFPEIENSGILSITGTYSHWKRFGVSHQYGLLAFWLLYVTSQVLFIVPRFLFQIRRKLMFWKTLSMTLALSVIFSFIMISYLALFLDFFDCWTSIVSPKVEKTPLLSVGGNSVELAPFFLPNPRFALILCVPVWFTSWLILMLITRLRSPNRFERILPFLFVLAIIPVAVSGSQFLIINETPFNITPNTGGIKTAFVLASTSALWLWGSREALKLIEAWRCNSDSSPHCFSCGYDLRGTLSAGRNSCPECGELFVAATKTVD